MKPKFNYTIPKEIDQYYKGWFDYPYPTLVCSICGEILQNPTWHWMESEQNLNQALFDVVEHHHKNVHGAKTIKPNETFKS